MGLFASFSHYDWERCRQDNFSYNKMLSLIEFNFEVDADWFRYYKCVHCGDEFDGDKGAVILTNHLKSNHLGEIIEKEDDV